MAERKKRESLVPDNETPEDRFIRLANYRVTKTIERISQIGNLAGPQYHYTDDQLQKIEVVLSDALVSTMAKFNAAEIVKSGFSL